MFGSHPICECGFTLRPSEGCQESGCVLGFCPRAFLACWQSVAGEQGTLPSAQLREELREIHRHRQSWEPQLHTLGNILKKVFYMGMEDCPVFSVLVVPGLPEAEFRPDINSTGDRWALCHGCRQPWNRSTRVTHGPSGKMQSKRIQAAWRGRKFPDNWGIQVLAARP